MTRCSCFPGACRGGEVINGKLANGQRCAATIPAGACAVCHRDHERMERKDIECSHVDCPHRRHAWSERPQPGYRAPENYPNPLDEHFDREN